MLMESLNQKSLNQKGPRWISGSRDRDHESYESYSLIAFRDQKIGIMSLMNLTL